MGWRDWLRPDEHPKTFRIQMDAEGLSLSHESKLDPLWRIGWADVVKVWAYKKDCFAVDQLRVVVVTRDGLAYEILENDPGFADVEAHLIDHLPVRADWLAHVLFATPPFDGTPQIIFQR